MCPAWLILLGFYLFGSASVAEAQAPSPAPVGQVSGALPSPAQPDSAAPGPDQAALDELLRQALAAYAADDFVRARSLFSQVHEEAPSARSLRGLGIVAYRQGQFADAIVLLEQSLVSSVKPLTPAMAQGVTALLADGRAHVGRLQLEVSPKNAEVRVDDSPAIRDASGALLVTPGSHRLTASAPNASPAMLTVESLAGSLQRIDLVLPVVTLPAAALEPGPAPILSVAHAPPLALDAAPLAVSKPQVAKRADVPRATSHLTRRTWARVLAGTAGVALITSAVGFGLWSARVDEIEALCKSEPGGRCSSSQASKAWDRKHLTAVSVLAISGAAVAGAAGATGLGLWLSLPRGRAQEPKQPLQAGIDLRLSF